jgi:S-disulfanyl-L-cysteine oxidoreductase SoxD
VNRTPRMFVWLVLGLAVCAVAVGAARSTESKSVWAGVYTEAQARRGAELFTNTCANCHGDDLAGIEQAPALTGDGFGDKWNTKTLNKLLARLQEMPPTKPKSLTPEQYTDVLAYVLYVNELPTGDTPLKADMTELADITYSNVKPAK